ncbi:phosphoribosylglycinamide formyltransferase [Alkalibacter rhizosphaerae]|uniref:Phosphoribosylglycinamide formyltransferase n=1 Tax=Alkalibacter rhizosphaerae TaxID=2815577 RepID=A0A974XET5_9FIRM|nr:phosphoribosylglycinamide formyltransferase [Alkalibacter rhizosphaerae]QSX07425.1 phosphoribosylglycinamide formyltransferase [Alkalibacter rhizosphaerae]
MSRVRIAVLVSGGGSNLQSLLDQIHQRDGDIVLVVSDRKDAYGLERAKKYGIPAIHLEREGYHERLQHLLEGAGIDLVVLAGYLKKVDPALVALFKNRMLNIHPSLIPAFCGEGFYGIHVHERALEYGVKISGATVHFVDEEMDTGPIVAQEPVGVVTEDTPKTLQQRVLKVEHRLLVESVRNFCQGRLQVCGRKVRLDKGGNDESTDQRIG